MVKIRLKNMHIAQFHCDVTSQISHESGENNGMEIVGGHVCKLNF